MEKYGFIYIWRDAMNKRYYVGAQNIHKRGHSKGWKAIKING
jgi:hypothetical protein